MYLHAFVIAKLTSDHYIDVYADIFRIDIRKNCSRFVRALFQSTQICNVCFQDLLCLSTGNCIPSKYLALFSFDCWYLLILYLSQCNFKFARFSRLPSVFPRLRLIRLSSAFFSHSPISLSSSSLSLPLIFFLIAPHTFAPRVRVICVYVCVSASGWSPARRSMHHEG